MSAARITLADLQKGLPKGRQPGEKYYNLTAGAKEHRCGNSNCSKFFNTSIPGNYRFVDDRLVRLCGECLLKFDQKQEGKK